MRQYINLYRGLEKKSSGNNSGVILMAVTLVALLGLGGYAFVQQRALAALQVEADGLGSQLQAGREHRAAAEKRVKQADGGSATLASLEARYQSRERLLSALASGSLGKREGYSEYLRAFTHRAGHGVWLTAFGINQGGTVLTLTGQAQEAERIPAYLASLNAEKVFQGRTFATLHVKQAADDKASEGKDGKRSPVEFVLGTEREAKAEGAVSSQTSAGSPSVASLMNAASGQTAAGNPSAASSQTAASSLSAASSLGAVAGSLK